MTNICIRQTSTKDITNPLYLNFFRFYHGKDLPRNTFVQYLTRNWALEVDPFEKLEERLLKIGKVQNLIIANEMFLPNAGTIRNNKVCRRLGEDWIKQTYLIATKIIPNTKLWICDLRPRDLKLWNGIREYVTKHNIDIYGLGIQVHASLLPILPSHWASPQNIPPFLRHHCNQNRKMGLKTSFSEVTCWCNDTTKRGLWYQNIIEIAKQEDIEWLNLWSPTPTDNWHWNNNHKAESHLWDENGNWLWDFWGL